MTKMTENEMMEINNIVAMVDRLKVSTSAAPPKSIDTIYSWFSYINDIKQAQGNINNTLSFLSCLMAKEYLCKHINGFVFDAACKKQGAPGPDIYEKLPDRTLIIGEIKNTIPYLGDDFGAAQWDSLENDFKKLRRSKANHKYFFLTDPKAYEILYKNPEYIKVPKLKVVLLPSGESFSA